MIVKYHFVFCVYRSDTGLFLVENLALNMIYMMMIKRKRISKEKVIE